jgi:uncharacterized damage-inducible protein DinB
MSGPPELFRMHIDYNCWATNRLLQIAQTLSRDQLDRDFGTADKSVAGTMVHLFRSERIWLGRILHREQTYILPDDSFSIAVERWPELQAGWRNWVAQLTTEDLNRVLPYKDLRGAERSNMLWQVILH